MKRTKLLIFGFLICLICNGQDTVRCNPNYFDDNFLDKLTGDWNLVGTIGKTAIKNSFSVSWILNHQFIEINFVDQASPPSYFAKVMIGYDCISERYVAHWFDIFGGRFSETLGYGVRKGQMIEFRFEYPEAPFINQFIYDNKNDGWQLHMTTKTAQGNRVLFGDEFLKRKG
ncbi:MAG: hypothetical protein ACHQET_13660 [Chitinophagales bacterium]